MSACCSLSCHCCKPYIRTAQYTQCHLKFARNCSSCASVQVFNTRDRDQYTSQRTQSRLYKHIDKILILGSSSVGKSSVFKCVKYRSGDENMETETTAATHVIRQNLVAGILYLLKKSQELYESYDSSYHFKYDMDLRETPNYRTHAQQIHITSSHNRHQKYNCEYGYEGYADENLLKCMVNLDDETLSAIQLCVNYGSESFAEVLDWNEVKELGRAIYYLWNLSAVQQTFLFRLKRYYRIPDCMDFFFDKSMTIMSEDYIPTVEDALKCRVRTTGMIEYLYKQDKESHYPLAIKKETRFKDDEREWIIYDVGGERNERVKWIHHFADVSCVLYVSALSQYCLSLFEDEKYICLLESMDLFAEICNRKWFKKSAFVLLLNKTDLFRENLKITPLTFCFGQEYKGRNFGEKVTDIKMAVNIMTNILRYFMGCTSVNIPNDVILIISWYFNITRSEWWLDLCYNDGIQFIKQKFISLNKNPKRKIHVYEVMAVDPVQIESVMAEVHDITIENNLKKGTQIQSLYP